MLGLRPTLSRRRGNVYGPNVSTTGQARWLISSQSPGDDYIFDRSGNGFDAEIPSTTNQPQEAFPDGYRYNIDDFANTTGTPITVAPWTLGVRAKITNVEGRTAARSTSATYFDEIGVVQTAGVNVLRDNHHVRTNESGNPTRRVTVTERAYTSLAVSQDISTWTEDGSCGVAGSLADPAGGTTAYTLTGTAITDARYVGVTYTGNATKAFIGAIRAGTSAASRFGILDTSAPATRHRVDIVWSAGVPTVTTESGSGIISVQPLSGGWYGLFLNAAGVVAANTNRIYVYPGNGTMGFWKPATFNAVVPPPTIFNASETRGADSLTVPLKNATPQAATYLWDFVMADLPNKGTRYVIGSVGDADGLDPHINVWWAASTAELCVSYADGETYLTGGWDASTWALSDRLTVRVTVDGDGNPSAWVERNG